MLNWIERVDRMGAACSYKDVTPKLLIMLIIYMGLCKGKVKDEITKAIGVLETDLTEKLCREKQALENRVYYSKEPNKRRKKRNREKTKESRKERKTESKKEYK